MTASKARRRCATLLAALALAGCDDLSMAKQKKYPTYAPSGLWADGAASRTPPDGTVAQGDLASDAGSRRPVVVTQALMARGRERFDVFCSPCHGRTGAGDGMIVARGFPGPPSYHTERLRAAPADYLYGVITNGYGIMYPYRSRVAPADRWAIVAYLRALQQAEHTRLADAPDIRAKLP